MMKLMKYSVKEKVNNEGEKYFEVECKVLAEPVWEWKTVAVGSYSKIIYFMFFVDDFRKKGYEVLEEQ